MSTPMCSLRPLPPAGHVYGCTKPCNSSGNRSSITTRIPSSMCIVLINLTSPSAPISVSSPTNLNPVSTLRNFVRVGLKTMDTDATMIKRNVKSRDTLSMWREWRNSIMRCCVKTPWTNSNIHWGHRGKRAFIKHVKSSANPNSTNFIPSPPTKTINSSSTNASFNRGPRSPILMGTVSSRMTMLTRIPTDSCRTWMQPTLIFFPDSCRTRTRRCKAKLQGCVCGAPRKKLSRDTT